VGAGVAAGEAVLQDAAGEKPVHDRGDDGAPRAVGGAAIYEPVPSFRFVVGDVVVLAVSR